MNLLNDIISSEGKMSYREFMIELGIEKFTVLIPLKESDSFESEVKNLNSPKRADIENQAIKSGGKII